MPSIGDNVKANPDAEFASDAQLQWSPDDERNVALAKGYIFTSRATHNHLASVEIVERLQKALTWEGEPNRFVVIATYGHGKSHLALALANYFGMPEGSDVVTGILNNIAHAVDQPAEAQKFRDFKANHAPYLVVRLHGAEMKSLHQQLISGLETALKECPQTSDESLPFWFNAAESFLKGLDGEQLEKANGYLDGHGTEVNILLRRVRDRDTTAHELCRQVFRHLIGTPPDFGGDIGPGKAVEWAADEFCGEGKPFPGMVILFDEFSAFIRNYASGAVVHADGVLQGLLDAGIRACVDAIPPAQRKLVTDHDAFGYFARRYGLDVVGAVIPSQSTSAQPSARELRDLVRTIESEHVRAVFPERSVNPKLAEAIAAETGARADLRLYGDTLGPAGSSGATYLAMEQANADAIVAGLSGGRVRCPIAALNRS